MLYSIYLRELRLLSDDELNRINKNPCKCGECYTCHAKIVWYERIRKGTEFERISSGGGDL